MSTIKTRVRNKNDIKAHWDLAENFKPLKGEIILYTDTRQMKVGDGDTVVGALPFYPSGDVTAAGDNIFTGSNSFTNGISLNDPSTTTTTNSITALSKDGFKFVQVAATAANTIAFQTLPNGSVGESYTIPLLETNNTFTGTNTFKDNQISIEKTSTANGPSYPGIYMNNERLLVGGGDTVSSQTIITAEKVGISTPNGYCSLEKDGVIKNGSSSDEAFSLTLPKKNGTLATTDYVTANPTASGTAELSKIQVGDTVYTLPSGGSGDVTAAGNNTFTGNNIFKKAVTLYTDASMDTGVSATLDSYKLELHHDFASTQANLNIANETQPYLELKTGGHGKVKYTQESIIYTDTIGNQKNTTLKFPGQGATADSTQTLATLEGNQTFTKAITTTDVNGFIIAPTNTNNYTASIWIDSASLTENQGNINLEIYRGGVIATEEWTTAQLQGLFTYANNTLTINI